MIVLNGNTYATSKKLDVFTQLHIARKLGDSIPMTSGIMTDDKANSILSIILLSQLSDENSEYVITKCLSVVSRQQPTGFAPVRVGSALMFDDITLDDMLQMTMMVIKENLGDFFRTALGSLNV